jgi:hypothetical protein
MTPLPNLPTDSLYKYAATLCVALAIASMMGGVSMVNGQRHMIRDVSTEFIALAEGDWTAEEKNHSEVLKELLTVSAKDSKLCLKYLAGSTGAFMGCFMIALTLWYWKEQRHKDELLRRQVDDKSTPPADAQ